jgi:myo-inositol-1(or 4)-monophosphatase
MDQPREHRALLLAHSRVVGETARDHRGAQILGARVREQQGAVFARLIHQVRDVRRFGSAALDLAWTAAGRYDAYFERSVKPWDIAAGVLLCRSAGLEIRDLPATATLPYGILVAAPGIAPALHELVS